MLYGSARTRAKWVYVAFALYVVAALLNISATFQEIELLQRIDVDWRDVSPAEADASDARVLTTGLLSFTALVAAVTTFCFWIHRANRNLPVLTHHFIRFSPGWSIGWFFIPIMNLFRPYQVMDEIYRQSHPRQAGSPLIGVWWGLWLAGGFAGQAALRALFEDSDVATLIARDWLTITSDIVLIIAAIVVIVLIHRITSWQDGRGLQERMAGYRERAQAPSDPEPRPALPSSPHDSADSPDTSGATPPAPLPGGGIAERLRELPPPSGRRPHHR